MDFKKEFSLRKIKQETESEPYTNTLVTFASPSNPPQIKFEDTADTGQEPEDQIENALEAIVNGGQADEANQLRECKNVPLAKNIDVEETSNAQMCRLCAQPITCSEIFVYGDLEQKINYALPITMSMGDGLPQYICRNCEINLNMFYDFVCQVVNADKTFRSRPNASDFEAHDITSATIKQIFGADSSDIEKEIIESNRSKCLQCDRIIGAGDSEHLCDMKVSPIKSSDKKPNKNLLQSDDSDRLRKIQKVSISDLPVQQQPSIPVEQHKCQFCNEIFSDYFALVHHSKQSHGKVHYPCPEIECNETFATEKFLRQHINETHNVPVICFKCGKIFTHQGTLQKHHDNNHFFKVCENCGMSFKSFLSFKTHRLLHTEVSEYQCIYCYKNFKNRHQLHRHTRQCHSGNFTLLVDSSEDEVDKSSKDSKQK